MRVVPLILALTVLALVLLGLVWMEPKPASGDHHPNSTLPHLMRRYQVGHDWVEPPLEADTAHPLLKGDWQAKTAFQCTQPECRTCQWMRMFGGEW